MSKTKLVSVVYEPEGMLARVPVGTLISKAAAAAGKSIEAPCGGIGVCGKCRVVASGVLSPPDAAELHHLTESELAAGVRLACRAKILGDCHISIPESSRSVVQKILSKNTLRDCALDSGVQKFHCKLSAPTLEDGRADFERIIDHIGVPATDIKPVLSILGSLSPKLRKYKYDITAVLYENELIAVEPGDTTSSMYGVAFDLGSTSIVGYLMNLANGQQAAVHSVMNPQMVYGDDLISRISFATTQENGARNLHAAALDAINRIIGQLCDESGIAAENIYKITIVGNTCMSHLLLGIDAFSLGQSPYSPSVCRDVAVPAEVLGVDICPGGYVQVLPNIAGFVGSDTVAVMLADMWQFNGRTRLAVDIGTNGEMALSHNGSTFVCSAAAGPAFEGAKISSGMRGGSGAIDSVRITDHVEITVIGDAKPIGICGSGLVDAVAQMLEAGAVDPTGRLLPPDEAQHLPPAVLQRLVDSKDGVRFVLATEEESGNGKAVSLKESDIRQLQLAKGSIHAAIKSLLYWAEAEVEDLDEIMLAGAFGNYIRVESAITIGIIPNVGKDRVKSIGNAAGAGSKLALLCKQEMQVAKDIAAQAKHLELAISPVYQIELMDQMMFSEDKNSLS